jgi:hypothetical protein
VGGVVPSVNGATPQPLAPEAVQERLRPLAPEDIAGDRGTEPDGGLVALGVAVGHAQYALGPPVVHVVADPQGPEEGNGQPLGCGVLLNGAARTLRSCAVDRPPGTPLPVVEEVAHRQPDGGDDLLDLAAREALRQHPPVLALGDAEGSVAVLVGRAEPTAPLPAVGSLQRREEAVEGGAHGAAPAVSAWECRPPAGSGSSSGSPGPARFPPPVRREPRR